MKHMQKPKPPSEDIMLTTDELAARWKLTPDHLEVKRMRGEGPRFIKLGDDPRAPVRYRLEDVLDYENNHTRHNTKRKK
jgi:hypothetical protein